MQQECNSLVIKYGADIIKYLAEEYTADEVCRELTICTDPKCNLFSPRHHLPRKLPLNFNYKPKWKNPKTINKSGLSELCG